MHALFDIEHVSRIIQLSVAPVLMLVVVCTIVSRLTDHLTNLTDQLSGGSGSPERGYGSAAQQQLEAIALARRVQLTGSAIRYCTLAAVMLLIATVATLFVWAIQNSIIVVLATLVAIAMLLLAAGLVCFLRAIIVCCTSSHT